MLLREYKHDEGGVKLFVLKKIGNYKPLPFIDEREMQGISINGYYLHEIKMLMVPNGAIRLLSYSKQIIKFEIVGDKLCLNLPTFLALELYRRAIFPQDPSKSISVKISGKDVGRFLILDLRYPNDYENYVSMTLQREKQQKR